MTQDTQNSIAAWVSVSVCALLAAVTLYLLRGVDTRGWQPWATGLLCLSFLVNVIRLVMSRRGSSKVERH